MDYQDSSSTGGNAMPDARNDGDVIAANSRGPAIGNTITGVGTVTGAAGADVVSEGPGQVVSIQGAGGTVAVNGGIVEVAGQYGTLSISANGNYRYMRDGDSPDGVRDVFTYTLADAGGDKDKATLTIDIGREPKAVAENAQMVVPGPDGVVTLPAGVQLSDIMVVGRNLVINLPDGTQMVIVDGAIFVPQLVLGGVEVPATNLAALLIDFEPQPAAGTPQSSGGNFAIPVGPLDPGEPLGDLIPPTVLTYTPPPFEEVGGILDRDPEILIDPGNGIPVEAAVDQVNEAGLPARTVGGIGEPAGSNSSSDGETTTGTIFINSPDTPNQITITVNGVTTVVTGVNQVIAGVYGNLTITSVSEGAIGYSYTLRDNTTGDTTRDDFIVTVTDKDGDTDTATLRIDIIDDVPTARPDSDSIAAGEYGPATGNVITDAAAGDSGDSDTNAADTVGADGARVTAIDNTANAVAAQSVPATGTVVVDGQYGKLTISASGDYSYTRNAGTPGGVTETFSYTITDGDGDPSTSTLTITIADRPVVVGDNALVRTDDDAVPNAGGNPGTPENGDDADAANLNGTLSGSGGDGPLTFDLLTTGAPSGFAYVDGANGSVLVQQVQNGQTVTVLTVTINATTGAYTVTQNAPILHDSLNGAAGDDSENNVAFTINYTVSDQDNDSLPGKLTIDVDDDTPVATQAALSGTVDEDGLAGGNAGGVNDVTGESVSATGNVATLFSAGADKPLTYSLVANFGGLPALTSNGVAVTYAVSFNATTGVYTLTASAGSTAVFTLTLNSSSGAYNFTLLDQLDHPTLNNLEGDNTENPTASDIAIALGSIVRATDSDGDSVNAPASGLVITVDDDTPVATTAVVGGTVDEDGLAGGNLGGVNDVEGAATIVTGNVGTLFSAGADQPLTYSMSSNTSVLPALTSNKVAVTYAVTFNAQTGVYTLTASAGATPVFTLTLNASSGAYTFTLLDQLDHPTLNDLTGDNTENPTLSDISLAFGALIQATDTDGDAVAAATGGLVIVVDDDSPTATENVVSATVDEDGLSGGNAGGVNDVTGQAVTANGSITTLFSAGADQPLTYSLSTNTSGLPALTSGNVAVTYSVAFNAETGVYTLTAMAGQTPVFTLTLTSSTGAYSFTLLDQLDHATLNGLTGDDTENPTANDIAIAFGSILQATDADGDTVTANNGGLVVTVDDDSPDRSTGTLSGTVDEDGLTGGNIGGVNDVVGEPTQAQGNVAGLFLPGADQPLTYQLLSNFAGLPALTSNKVAVTYAVTYNAQTGVYTLTASAGATPVFTLTLASSSGAYTFTLLDQLDHASLDGLTGDDTENPTANDITIAFGSIIQGTDADGDSITAAPNGLVITVDDDTPIANLNTRLTGTVDEDGVTGGNAGGVNDVEGQPTTAEGSVATLFNAGADQPLTYQLLSNFSGLPALTSNHVAVTYAVTYNAQTGVYTLTASAGANTVFTFTLNSSSGAYTFTLVDQLDHVSLDGLTGDDTENPTLNDISIALGSIIQATDADGDSVTALGAGLVITVDDDTPNEFDGCPDPVSVVNSDGSTDSGSLNLPSIGADGPGDVSFAVEPGDPVLDTKGLQISSDGQLLFYYVNSDGVLEARAGGETGEPVFTVTLDGNGGYLFAQTGDITSTTTLSIANLSSVGGGNVSAKVINTVNSPYDLVLSTQNGNTVNTNATEMGVGQGNSFEAGEKLRVDLVMDSFASGSGGGTILNFGEYYTANAYRQDVSGVGKDDGTGGPQRADFIVRAITVDEAAGSQASDPADGDLAFYTDTNDDFLTGTTINLYNSTGQLVNPTSYTSLGITVTDLGTGWQIVGLPDGYDFEIVSSTPFNAVQVEAIAGTDTFKLGFIDITTVVQTQVDLQVPIAFTDEDGDSVYCDIDISLSPPVNLPNVAIQVDEAALNNVGSTPLSPAETQTGDLDTFTTGGNGPYTYALVGTGVGTYGTLTIGADGVYTYTLSAPVTSDPTANDGANTEIGVETYSYTVTDKNGLVETATIRIDIVDDRPTAVLDTDAVSDGGPLVATGNVLTDGAPGDDGDTDNGADTLGADRPPAVVSVAFEGGTAVAAPTTIQGKYGSLQINGDGSYTYTLNPADADYGDIIALDSGEFINEIFNYTMADADGDRSSSTLTVRINGVNNPPTASSATAVVSEEGLTGGIADSLQASGFDDLPPAGLDDTNSTTATGSLTLGDVDLEALTLALSAPTGTYTTANDAVISWAVTNNGHTLTGTANGQTAVIVTITDAGVYNIAISQPLDHGSDGSTESELTISVPVTVSDGTATGSATITIHVEDDMPTAVLSGQSPNALFVSDANLAVDDSKDFSTYFTLNVGADGAPAGADGTTYSLGVNGGATGLFDTATKLPVSVFLVTNTASPIYGSVVGVVQIAPSNFQTVFVVSVNADTGNVSLNQLRPVYHSTSDASATGDSDVNETLLTDNLITLTARATDADGDFATQTVGIGSKITFGDAYPSIDIGVTDSATNFIQTSDANTIGTATDTVVSTEAFNGAFFLIDENFGGDGEGSSDAVDDVTWSLTLKVAEGTVSGLTSGGVAIRMYIDANGVIIGSTSASEVPATDASTVFTLSVDEDGVVMLKQMQQIDHTNVDPSPTATPFGDHAIALPNDLVSLNVTATAVDGDQDIASESLSLDLGGNIKFADHGPTAVADTDAIASGDFGVATGNVLTGLEVNSALEDSNDSDGVIDTVGADTPIRVSGVKFTLNDSNPANDTVETQVVSGSFATIQGQYGVLTIWSNGDYSYDRNTGSAGGVSDTFIYEITDRDGDTAETTLTINIANARPIAGTSSALLDDDGLFVPADPVLELNVDDIDANVDETPPPATASEATYKGSLSATGGDGDLDYSLIAPVGQVSVGQEKVTFAFNIAGELVATIADSPIVARIGTPLFKVALDGESGNYVTTLQTNVLHAADNNENEDGVEVQVQLAFQVSDVDGSSSLANGTITISFNDDIPTVAVTKGADSGITLTTQDGDTDATPVGSLATDTAGPTNFAGVFGLSYTAGADGAVAPALTYSLGFAAGASGLFSGKQAIYLYKIGNNIVGSTSDTQNGVGDANKVFEVSVVASGANAGQVTLTQYQRIDHGADGSLTDDSIALADTKITLTASASVTDADGDTAGSSQTIDIGANLIFQDENPDARNDSDVIVSGSNAPATGNVITGTEVTGDTNATDGTADIVGADVPGTVVLVKFTDPTNADPLTNTTTVAVPTVGSTTIDGNFGTLTIFADGRYSYARDAGTPGNATDVFVYTLEDSDGDRDTATLTIGIEDAGVTVAIPTGEAETYVYETALGTAPQGRSEAAAIGANDDPNEVVTGTITFNALDGVGSITIAGVLLTGTYPQTIVNDATGTLKITSVTYNSANGNGSIVYEYTLKDNTLGSAPPATGDTTVTFDVDIVDGDGDHSPDGNLVITIVDDDIRANDDLGISVNEGGSSAPGNVLTNDVSGADGYAASPNGAVISLASDNQSTNDLSADGSGNYVLRGQYGELTLNRDGTYSYKADADIASLPANAKDTFTYVVRDGDGDTDPAKIEFLINPVTVNATDQDASVDEAGLPLIGSAAATDVEKDLNGQITPSGGIGGYTYTLTSANGGDGTYGTLVLNANGSYTYVLDTTFDGPTLNNSTNTITNAESFSYRVTDGNGNTFNGTIVIDIIDDVPTARDDTDTVTEDTKLSATGNVITGDGSDLVAAGGDTKGADGATVTFVDGLNTGIGTTAPTVVGTTLTGEYGTLLIKTDGSYTYTLHTEAGNPAGYAKIQLLDGGDQVTETFAYTLTDGDGDESIANLVITITGTNDIPNVTGSTSIVSDEAMAEEARPGARPNEDNVGIADTNAGATDSDSLTITDADGTTSFIVKLGLPTTSHTVDGVAVTWALSGNAYDSTAGVLIGSVAGLGEVIRVALTNTSGGYTVTQSHALDQGGTANTETDGTITVPVTVSDGAVVTPIATTITVKVEDDSPIYSSEIDASPVENSNTSFAGQFNYRIGADEHIEWSTDHEIAITEFTGKVGTGDLYNRTTQFISADPTTEVWQINFTYNAKPGDATTAQSTFATVTFNKATGGYTVVLDDPIQSYATDSVQGAGPTAYTFNGGSGGASQYDSANVAIEAGKFYIQLTGDVGNNTTAFQTQGSTFEDGDTFYGANSWVSISSSDIAAGGNSLQSKNIMDLNFYKLNPGTTTNATPTTGALGTFVIIDQVIPSEDIVVVLKLAAIDANGNVTSAVTTRAIAVNYNDLFTSATKPSAYSDVTLTGNELLLVIEQGDYAALVPAGYQLVGLQITTSVESIGGSYYDFDGRLGFSDTDALTAAEKASLTDGDVIKIVDVGVVRLVENQEALSLDLNVTVTDGDGDSFSEHLLVNPPPATTALTSTMVVSKEAVNDNDGGNTLLSTDQQLRSMNGSTVNSATFGAIAGAGLAATTTDTTAFTQHSVGGNGLDMAALGSNTAVQGLDSEALSALLLNASDSLVQSYDTHSGSVDSYFAGFGAEAGGILGNGTYGLPSNETRIPVNDDPMAVDSLLQSVFGDGAAMTVTIPPAAMLQDIGGSVTNAIVGVEPTEALVAAVDGIQHNGDVARVLADALAGGGGGHTDIDALVSALPARHSNAEFADAMASHFEAAVSAWDMGGVGGYAAPHSAFTMEAMVLHHMVVQAA